MNELTFFQDAKDSDTLANLIVCSLHLSKPANRYLRFVSFFDIVVAIYGGLNVLFIDKNHHIDPCLIIFVSSQLKMFHPAHGLLKRASDAESAFDRALQAVV